MTKMRASEVRRNKQIVVDRDFKAEKQATDKAVYHILPFLLLRLAD